MSPADVRPLYAAKAELLRALGHPVRIRILELLTTREHVVHELLAAVNSDLPIAPSNLSHQLAVLRRAGVVEQSREGGEVRYRVAVDEVPAFLAAARGLLEALAAAQVGLHDRLVPDDRNG